MTLLQRKIDVYRTSLSNPDSHNQIALYQQILKEYDFYMKIYKYNPESTFNPITNATEPFLFYPNPSENITPTLPHEPTDFSVNI